MPGRYEQAMLYDVLAWIYAIKPLKNANSFVDLSTIVLLSELPKKEG